MDVDLRLLRYFAAVAGELSFTRAAERLHVSQPALSKQIRQLERALDVELLVRNGRSVELTRAGAALCERSRKLLDDWDDARAITVETAAAERRRLRVGYVASIGTAFTRAIIEDFRAKRPGWHVVLRLSDWSDPSAGLSCASNQVALLRLPFPGQEGFEVRELMTEDRWLAMPEWHRLASREVLSIVDLVDEPFVALPREAGSYRDYWLATDERRGRPINIVAEANNPDDWFEAITAGAVALTPTITTQAYVRPGIVYRRVTDVMPSVLAACWKKGKQDAGVRDFVDSCLSSAVSHIQPAGARERFL